MAAIDRVVHHAVLLALMPVARYRAQEAQHTQDAQGAEKAGRQTTTAQASTAARRAETTAHAGAEISP